MSIGAASVSVAEVRTVQDAVAHDVREDGRTLLQRRPIHITHRTSPSSPIAVTAPQAAGLAAPAGGAQETYNGSYVEVNASGTVVVAAATPSVVDGCAIAGPHASSSTAEEQVDTGKGELHITIDATPHVLDAYASAVGGRNMARYRRDYLAFLASTIRQVFGASLVQVQEQQGVAEVEVVPDDSDALGDTTPDAVTTSSARRTGWASADRGGKANGFPASDLYVGEGFGFRLHVDVHVLQCSGGNLFTAIAYAVHAALRSVSLPAVTLHKAPGEASGTSVEVDPSQPYRKSVNWTQLPLLCVLLVSPTGHYVVDPTLREEWALPQQLCVAAGANGQVMYFRYQQLPSRRGNAYRLRENDPHSSRACAAYVAPPSAMVTGDCWSILSDAVHLCQAMVHECEEGLLLSSMT